MRPLAIIPVYNEADILPAVLAHLEQQGCDVYVLDNWSTDLSPELLSRLGSNIERWPAERPSMYEWTAILTRIEEIALERGKGRWIILHDADEIRRAPSDWATLTLEKALEIATLTGYNAVQFKVRTFVPTDNLWKAGDYPERHFRYHRSEHVDHGIPHIKAWFQHEERVDLHTHGGHQAVFSDRHVCPNSFVLKHYPIRSQEHGERKIVKERFPRYPPAERSKQWHVQYDEYAETPTPNFLCNPQDLCKDKNRTTIVTLTSSREGFTKCADSIELHDPSYRRIVVTLGDITINRSGWEEIKGTEPFAFARNLNLGIAAAGTDDVLYVRDDVEFVGPVAEELSEVSHLTSAAIVSPQVIGGSDNRVTRPVYDLGTRWKQTRQDIPFACVFLPRAALEKLGQLDESFTSHGREDVEFSRRAVGRGLPLVVCRCRVRHDDADKSHTSSDSPATSSIFQQQLLTTSD